MNMHNPARPCELLTGWLDDLGASVTAFAAHIGISRVMLSRVLHGHAVVSADMDLRLADALGTTPGYWLALQTPRDLWTARQTAKERAKGWRPSEAIALIQLTRVIWGKFLVRAKERIRQKNL